MSRYAQPMSQTLAEMKMNDPKLLKVFNKLKPKATVKIKHSSTLEKGKDFIEYIVKSKNTLRNGVEKITLARKDSPTSVKRFLYNRDGKVTFAVGDMAASIDDIKEGLDEGYESEVLKVLDDAGIDGYFRNGKLYVDRKDAKAAKDALEDADNIMKLPKMVKEEVEDLDEMDMKYVLINMHGKVQGYASDKKDALDIARRTKSTMHPIKKKISDKTLEKMNALAKTPKELKDLGIIEEIDPADIDDLATDADKKAADKNMVMQMRKALDVKGNMKIEFGDGKKEKVDPKILQMMVTAHGKIQKPRDKEKFVAMISKSKRDMLMVAKKLGTLKMDLDKEDEPIVKKVVQMLKKASKAHAGQADDLDKAIKETLDIKEGTWKYPDNDKEVAALKKLMSRPLPIGNTEDEKMYKDSASSKLYSLLGDDELFDALGALEDKGKEKADARPVIIKWFQQRVKNNRYDLGDETKELGKQIGLKMEYVPEGLDEALKGFKVEFGKGNTAGMAVYKDKKDAEAYAKRAPKPVKITQVTVKNANMFDDPQPTRKEEVELDEKYDLYHKTFSDAMQHAYDYAKKKLGITVDPKEIDNKVATGPKKPSEGKTNKYRLKGKGGNLQIQVYNKGGSKPFELNMYKEENEMSDKLTGGNISLKETVLKVWQEAAKDKDEGFASDAQRKAAFASGYKEKGKKKDKEEGNEFSGELDKARKAGKKTFKVGGKEYPVKPAKKEQKEEFSTPEIERYLQTKTNSLRDAVLQMWGEGVKEDKKTLTKEKKNGIKKMTDTGKEVTPVETSVKMPKIKETNNKV